ncbi:MAG: hypothetical protein ABWY58_10310 [Aeromicrobium sp.]
MTAEFPPELTEDPETSPAWWRWPATVGVLMTINVMNFALTTDHRRVAKWVLVAVLVFGSAAIARKVWKHRATTARQSSSRRT